MNNFDPVFSVVKNHCSNGDGVENPHCLEEISKACKLPLDRLDFYLNTLEAVGLIKYSMSRHYIKLTPYGKLKSHVFAS